MATPETAWREAGPGVGLGGVGEEGVGELDKSGPHKEHTTWCGVRKDSSAYENLHSEFKAPLTMR